MVVCISPRLDVRRPQQRFLAKAENSGGIIAFDLTGGQFADTTRFETLLKGRTSPDAPPWATKDIPARLNALPHELAALPR